MAISQIYDMSARQVWVGRYDEHGSREVAWDVSPWTSKLGSEGVFALLVTRPRDTDSPYNAQVSFDATTNLVTWAVTDIDTALKGWGRAELHYYVDGALVKSQTFVTIIEKAMFAGSTAPSAAESWVERMEQAALDAQAAAETAEDAEATATSAATTATSAAATAITAANSASSSASSARADATTATNAATAAALSESAASTSATNAAASAEAASTSALTASTAASTATTKASQASASASTAATAATTATNKATEATTAATTATTKAGEASTSASTATSAKDTAVSASQTATTKATEATTAAATATSAKTDAVAANTAAQSAKTAAQTAQTGAETAAASVSASAEQIATNAADISQLKSDITSLENGKANVDGYYADLVSGGATQILSDMVETDTTPYNYRTAGGSLEIGDRMKLKKIVGGSLAVNQLCFDGTSGTTTSNGITYTLDATTGALTVNGTATGSGTSNLRYMTFEGNSIPKGHKLLLGTSYGVNNSGLYTEFAFRASDASIIRDISIQEVKIISLSETAVGTYIQNRVYEGTTFNNLKTYKPMLFDLTQMFGSTIADYIYLLEQATAGAGVAWFKKLFPKDYYEYNAGELLSVSGLQSHDMVGFNLLDEETVLPSLGFTKEDDGSWYIASASSVQEKLVWENKCGYIGQMCVSYDYKFDSSSSNGVRFKFEYTDGTSTDNYVTSTTSYSHKTAVSSSGKQVERILFTYGTDSVKTWLKDINVNFSWDGERDGEYEPYEEHVYPLDSDVTLRGIPKLDANNNLYYDGDVYEPDGTVTRKYGTYTFTGSETLDAVYTRTNGDKYGIIALPNAGVGNGMGRSSNGIPFVHGDDAYSGSGTYFSLRSASKITVSVAGATSGADITAWLTTNKPTIVYELATPTEESADPYTEIQNVSNWGTKEFVTTSLVPVGHETAYQPDLRAKIEVAPESPDTDGMYLMKRENGQNSYVAYLGELPSDPTTDGTYTLKCTVASGVATKTWEADE